MSDDMKQLVAIEQEQSVLGALLINNDAIDRIGDLRASHFFQQIHRYIFDAIMALIMQNKAADVITVYERLRTGGHGETADLQYLNALQQNTPSAANIRHYADIVKDRAMKREISTLGDEMCELARMSPEDATAIVDAITSKLERMAQSTVKNEPMLASDTLVRHIESIDERYNGSATTTAISTGLVDLDKKLNGGFRRGNLIIIAARPKMGKAQPLSSNILLSNGQWKKMGEIACGDKLASSNGCSSNVTAITPQGVKDIYKITFSDGRSAECCEDHLWKIKSRHWKSSRILSIKEIQELLLFSRHKRRLHIPLLNGEFGVDSDLPVDPYTLGALIGDGGLTKTIKFTTADSCVIEHLKLACPGISFIYEGRYQYRAVTPKGQRNWLLEAVRGLGLIGCKSDKKFIPIKYLTASKISREALLQGLMDTDGWSEKKGSCLISTSSRQLADDITYLARSLGCVVRRKEKAPFFTHNGERKNGLKAYVLTIACEMRTSLFRMKRKIEDCGGKFPRLVVESIKKIGKEECQCISVSAEDRLYVTDNFILTHNSAFALNTAMHVAENGVAAVLSQEMTLPEIHDRNIAHLGGIHLDHLIDPKQMTDEDWNRLTHSVQKLSRRRIYLDDQPALTLLDVRSKAKIIKRKAGLDVLVIDYLQLMSAAGDNRNAQIESITRGLKNLAKELNIVIVLLSQLNRKVEDRPNKRPTPADLRDSGAIEQDCDICIFLYRDEVYNPDTMDRGICEINVALNRQGSSGTVAAVYVGEHTSFKDYKHDWHPPVPKKAPIRSRGMDDD